MTDLFPIFSKISVAGEDKHPLYAVLTEAFPQALDCEVLRERLKGYGRVPATQPEVLWNFEKFLISREGQVIGRFSPEIAPLDDRIVGAIEQQLRAGCPPVSPFVTKWSASWMPFSPIRRLRRNRSS